jgi:hypothetical protein
MTTSVMSMIRRPASGPPWLELFFMLAVQLEWRKEAVP